MSKAAAAPSPAAPAPAPTMAHAIAVAGEKGAAPPLAPAKVIMWDNDAQGDRPSSPGESAAAEALGGKPEIASEPPGNAGEKAQPAAAKAKEDEPGEAKPPTPAEKRAATFDRLGAERRHRELETALQTEQRERAADREKLTKLEGTIKGASIGQILALAGVSEDDALEALLKKDPAALAGAPAQSRKQVDPQIAELVETVKTLKDELDGYKRQGTDARVSEAIGKVQELTKDMDIPVVRVVEGGHELVMRTAHELWLASGRAGAMADYMTDAAGRAEAYFREQRPALAALADAARGGKPKPADGIPGSSPGIGRRSAARPDVKPKSVWEGKSFTSDRSEVDEQIKREMGLVDKDPLEQ